MWRGVSFRYVTSVKNTIPSKQKKIVVLLNKLLKAVDDCGEVSGHVSIFNFFFYSPRMIISILDETFPPPINVCHQIFQLYVLCWRSIPGFNLSTRPRTWVQSQLPSSEYVGADVHTQGIPLVQSSVTKLFSRDAKNCRHHVTV